MSKEMNTEETATRMEERIEQEIKAEKRGRMLGFRDGLTYAEKMNSFSSKFTALMELYKERKDRSVEYLEKKLNDINIDSIQDKILIIRNIEKLNKGIVNSRGTEIYIRKFEKLHRSLCEYIADKKYGGTWARK